MGGRPRWGWPRRGDGADRGHRVRPDGRDRGDGGVRRPGGGRRDADGRARDVRPVRHRRGRGARPRVRRRVQRRVERVAAAAAGDPRCPRRDR
ncbi:hypothetical protein CXF48_05420 [Corynebacterium bovis]|uniref:Uncharacterized protein n=1 Tax=Corynebacterium bovis TaxID=36808 RepID=A0A426PZB8_9CORY|nr:hypothetical protein CXF48_05420 [Corynebacterium bovis]RRO89101.1 hypothetical protein CXF30_04045 [Corynebacterium bovis]